MRLSYVLRLDPEALASDRLVGQVEAVADGAVGAFSSYEDLLAFCEAHAHAIVPDRSAGPGPAQEGNR